MHFSRAPSRSPAPAPSSLSLSLTDSIPHTLPQPLWSLHPTPHHTLSLNRRFASWCREMTLTHGGTESRPPFGTIPEVVDERAESGRKWQTNRASVMDGHVGHWMMNGPQTRSGTGGSERLSAACHSIPRGLCQTKLLHQPYACLALYVLCGPRLPSRELEPVGRRGRAVQRGASLFTVKSAPSSFAV